MIVDSFACRLCLKIYEKNLEETVLTEDNKIVLERIEAIPNINLNLTIQPVFCKNCCVSFQQFSTFKEKCVINENYIKAYNQGILSTDGKLNTDINLIDVLQHFGNECDEEGTDICRICLQYMNKNSGSRLESNDRYKNILCQIVPNFNIILVKDPLVCSECCNNIEDLDIFLKSCLKNQDYLQKYTREQFPILLPGDVMLIAKEALKSIEHEKYIQNFLALELNNKGDKNLKPELNDQQIPIKKKKSGRSKNQKCPYCKHHAKSKGYLYRHIKITHGKNEKELIKKGVGLYNYHCQKCTYKTNKKILLTKHIKLVHSLRVKVKIHKCKHCDFQTNLLTSLKVHMKYNHTDTNKFKCKLCEFETKLRVHLKDHVKKVHKNEEFEIFNCLYCDFETRRESSFEKHMRLNHKDTEEQNEPKNKNQQDDINAENGNKVKITTSSQPEQSDIIISPVQNSFDLSTSTMVQENEIENLTFLNQNTVISNDKHNLSLLTTSESLMNMGVERIDNYNYALNIEK